MPNGRMEEKLSDWKSEIIDTLDVIAKEINDEREFRDIASNQITSTTRRVEGLEKKVFGAVQSEV